jgi:transposase-like protein
MAAQLSPHTTTQISGLSKTAVKSKCKFCGEKTALILEINKINDVGQSRKRRYQCSSCNSRWTTYEVDQESYNELAEMRKKFRKMQTLMNSIVSTKEEQQVNVCSTCTYMCDDTCSFEVPEANTTYSFDCNLYKRVV